MILDVGCGGSKPWHTVRGDVNVDLEKPEGKLENFVVADAHHLPFQQSIFDRVVCYDVAQYFHDPLLCFSEMCKTLRQFGSFGVSVPNPLHYRRIIRYLLGKPIVLGTSAENPSDRHLQCWTDAEIKAILLTAGFGNITISFQIPEYRLKHDTRRRIRLDKIMTHLLNAKVSRARANLALSSSNSKSARPTSPRPTTKTFSYGKSVAPN